MDSEFQSTLPARGATRISAGLLSSAQNFNPRSPHGERLATYWETLKESTFQSTLPARGATTQLFLASCVDFISIHAPRTGSDGLITIAYKMAEFQSTLPARGATSSFSMRSAISEFQSTLPARGATGRCALTRRIIMNFNPRSPHGERRVSTCLRHNRPYISIHAPRTGSDAPPTTSEPTVVISIHAPRTGSDV